VTTTPKLTISTTFHPHGWTTTVTMPDGTKHRQVMKRDGLRNLFHGKGDPLDGLPDEIAEAADNMSYVAVVDYLNE
jgi:hypothetical protein